MFHCVSELSFLLDLIKHTVPIHNAKSSVIKNVSVKNNVHYSFEYHFMICSCSSLLLIQ